MRDDSAKDYPLAIRRDIVEGIDAEFVGHGLAFGKFMPPTNGHIYFLNFARASCRKLTILVLSLATEPIPGELRYKWIKELFPDCNVVHHYIDIPQEPKGPDDLAFFETWRDSIHKHCPGETFDALFASEAYGYKVARVMDIRFIPVNTKRDAVEISGTAMRNNPLQHWEHLHPVVRPYFLKRVAIVGPEASGKSTLARNLAKHFGTVRVSDYAQTLLADYAANIPGFDAKSLDVHDMSTIARGQLASEDALAPQANRVIFCDTELLSISNRSRRLFGACPAWIEQVAAERKYDLYLLLGQKDRACEVAAWRAELIRRSTPFTIIDGNSWDERLQKAIASVHQRFPALS